jgi:ppGpp synthetase/RelA/SpoT-type nucleotidyltranferase
VDYRDALYRRKRADHIARPQGVPEGLSCAGVRIVAYGTAHFEDIVKVLEDEFRLDAEASNADPRLGESRSQSRADTAPIEYAFPRYVVALTEERAALPEWKPYASLHVQIDVMTVLQWSWTDIDDDLPYFWAGAYPTRTRKLLYDAIGHLAAADRALSEFERLTGEIREEYVDAIRRGNVGLELNGESIRSYLGNAEAVSSLTAAAIEAGMTRDDEYEVGDFGAEMVLWVMRATGVETLPELDRFLREASERAPDVLRRIVLLAGERDFVPWSYPDSIVAWLLFVLRRADGMTVELTQHIEELEYALNTLIGNRVASDDRR